MSQGIAGRKYGLHGSTLFLVARVPPLGEQFPSFVPALTSDLQADFEVSAQRRLLLHDI